MKKSIFIIISNLLVLSSCGGYTKSKNLKINTLNLDNEFSIPVPIYYTNISTVTNFKFQEGYSIKDIKNYLSANNYYYEENIITYNNFINTYLFFNAIVNDKSEYFLIRYPSENDSIYTIFPTSCVLKYTVNTIGQLLIPYVFLKDKSDFLKIKDYIMFEEEKEFAVSIDINYKKAKFIYCQTAQKEITYDDINNKFTIYNRIEMSFINNELKYKKLY